VFIGQISSFPVGKRIFLPLCIVYYLFTFESPKFLITHCLCLSLADLAECVIILINGLFCLAVYDFPMLTGGKGLHTIQVHENMFKAVTKKNVKLLINPSEHMKLFKNAMHSVHLKTRAITR
jgi:hypothetical protein